MQIKVSWEEVGSSGGRTKIKWKVVGLDDSPDSELA